MFQLDHVDDETLLERLRNLVRLERQNAAEVVAHLAEVDCRGLALDRAFPSLFHYCVKELGYSPAAAYFRIRAARAARLFPQIIDMLRSSELHLETVVRLHPHLKEPGAAGLLECAKGKSARQVEALVAELSPEEEKPDRIRLVSERLTKTERPARDPRQLVAFEADSAERAETPIEAEIVKRVQIAFSADEEVAALLERAREILRHKYPYGRFEDIFREALKALLAKKDPDWRLLGRFPKKFFST